MLAHEPTSAVAKEVIAAYADEGGRAMANPVGTGPYRLTKWVRSSKIFLEANPDYRGIVWDFKPGADPEDAEIVREMKGKRLPQVGRIEISIMEEDQSRLLAFENGRARHHESRRARSRRRCWTAASCGRICASEA